MYNACIAVHQCYFKDHTCSTVLGFPGVYPWAAASEARGGKAAGWAINEPFSGLVSLPVDGEDAVMDEIVDGHFDDVKQVALEDLAGFHVYVSVSHGNVSFVLFNECCCILHIGKF